MGDFVEFPPMPLILRLTIERFRGIQVMEWHPKSGVNVILGGGDVGKTTILDAIALLLAPTNFTLVTDADYWDRKVENEFSIEAVMSLPKESPIYYQPKSAWAWAWDGKEPRLPEGKDRTPLEASEAARPVYRLRVRGTSDFELAYELLQPDETADTLTVALRSGIGVLRLGGDDRNDRDLRLVQGSALDRLLSDKSLRARLGQKLAENEIGDQLKDEGKERLQQLDEALRKRALPNQLGIGLTGGHGLSINALIGLTAAKGPVRLPLASWGAGTRRLASLQIAAAYQAESPITLVDEAERGLEPYRQRLLIASLQESRSQVFLTTHSPVAISAANEASLWYVDSTGQVGALEGDTIRRHQSRHPEAFLGRLTIVAEGRSEVGFVRTLLERAIEQSPLDHGIHVTDGGGNDETLNLLEALGAAGLKFGGFADDEGRSQTKWAELQARLDKLLFRWAKGCLEENIIKLIPLQRLEEFIKDPKDDYTGQRLRTLANRLGLKEKDFESIKQSAPDLILLVTETATGVVPPDKRNASSGEQKGLKRDGEQWFKSIRGGRELADKVFQFDLWPALKPQLLPFLDAVREAVGAPGVDL